MPDSHSHPDPRVIPKVFISHSHNDRNYALKLNAVLRDRGADTFFDQDDIVCPSQSFTTEDVTTVPVCTQLTAPLDGTENVNVGTNISWSYALRAIGYRLTLGTSPGSGDIINNLDVGNTLSYNPVSDFPPATTIYVRVIPYNENGNATGCLEESFTTGALGKPPGCTHLITPMDGEINVELSPLIEWKAIENAIGYKLFIGRSPFVNDIINFF